MTQKDKELIKRLLRSKERRRIKRNIWRKQVRLHKSKKKRIYGSRKKPINIVIPSILDLDENRNALIKLLTRIRAVLLNSENFKIDHSKMEKISEEALLLLTSEIERCTSLRGITLKAIPRLFPRDDNVLRLLNKIGYWDYFNLGHSEDYDESSDEKIYLKIVGDTLLSGEKIGSLIQFFEKLICFDAAAKDKFSDAMLEAAANTVEHAYTNSSPETSINKWWLTASLNKNTNEIAFIFYDQGVGILNTLESTRKHIKLRRIFLGWIKSLSKGGVLKKLMTTNLSSYKDERRGNGLISFKSFIDEVESGELSIYTDNVSYSAISDQIKNYNENLDGTLITWKIKVNCENDKCMYIKNGE